MYGSAFLRARHGRGVDWHNRLAMTQGGYYRAGGFFSSLVKGAKKAAGFVQGIGSSTVGQVLAPLNPFGRIASAAQSFAGNIPGIGGMVKAGSALQGMLFPTGKGPMLSQAASTAAGALGPALTGFNVWGGAVKGATELTKRLGGSPVYDRPAMPGEVRPEWLGGYAGKGLTAGGPGTQTVPSHTPFGGTLALPGASKKKKRRGGTSKRRRSASRSHRRGSSAHRRRAPGRRSRSSYRRGDYGDDWKGNRPSRAKRSGRFLTRRGGRHHKRRGGRVHFRTKDGRMVSFTPRHRKRRRRGHGASGTY